MILIRIFVSNDNEDGLHSVWYDDEESDEFERLIDLWTDPEYVREYCLKYESYFKTDYYNGLSLADITKKILDEANYIEEYLYNFQKSGKRLQDIITALHDTEYITPILQLSKVKSSKRLFPKPMLRFYAIKIDENTFVITGGAIKITKKMRDHPDTKHELSKLAIVRDWLKTNEIFAQEGLIYYYETNE